MTKFNTVLPYINSDEEYDQLNLDDELFKNAAREIIARHNLPAAPLSLLGGTNFVFSYGSDRIVKIFQMNYWNKFRDILSPWLSIYRRLKHQLS